jgi:hypothetical protein
VIISDGKTKGVKQGIGSGDLAKTVVGNWWQRQNTGVVRPPLFSPFPWHLPGPTNFDDEKKGNSPPDLGESPCSTSGSSSQGASSLSSCSSLSARSGLAGTDLRKPNARRTKPPFSLPRPVVADLVLFGRTAVAETRSLSLVVVVLQEEDLMAPLTRTGTTTALSIPTIRPRTTPTIASLALAPARARTTHEQQHHPFRRSRSSTLISSGSATLAPSAGTGGAPIRLSNLPVRDHKGRTKHLVRVRDDGRRARRRNSSSMQGRMVTAGGSESVGRELRRVGMGF